MARLIPSNMAVVVLGLGSNIGDREANLQQAIQKLAEVLDSPCLSPIYTTEALLLPDAPASWNTPYLNMAIKGTSLLSPRELLVYAKQIEKLLGRKDRGLWAPREIDVDILAYNTDIITEEDLQIPHRYLTERWFALKPFADVWPDWIYPVPGPCYGKTALELLEHLPSTTLP